MSSFDSLREPLGRVLECAERIAELAPIAINNVRPEEPYLDEIEGHRRDLHHRIKQAAASFSGSKPFADDLQHELDCVKDDVEKLCVWIGPAWRKLMDLWDAWKADTSVPFGEASQSALAECQKQRQKILKSCNRAKQTATTICAASDKSQIGSTNATGPKPDPERDALLTQADAEQAAIEEKRRRFKEERDTKERCQAANARFVESIVKFQVALFRGPFDNRPPITDDINPYLSTIKDELLEVCRVLKSTGHEEAWNKIKDRIDPRNTCSSEPRLTETSFKWATQMLNRGFAATLELSDIRATQEKPLLGGALTWVQLLINALLGEYRLDLKPMESEGSVPEERTAQAPATAPSPKAAIKSKGGRPSNDNSPSRKKQRWCYEQYIHQPTKKLSRILAAAKKEFGSKAPKSDQEIIIYAQRWATHKSLPFPRRN